MTPMVRPLTQRDLEVLLALLHKVRIFSIRQLAEHWWSSEPTNARKRLRLLADSNLLVGIKVSARTLPPLCAPVACWQPGQREPNFGAISYQLKSRWKQRPTRSVTAYVASERAGRLLGGSKRVGLKAGTQATHDLGVAAIWLHLRAVNPTLAERWRGEDSMAHTRVGEKIPDAFLVSERDQVQSVIEFGGAYNADRVEAFHADCEHRSLSYQIW